MQSVKCRKPGSEVYILYDAIYMTIWNRQAIGDRKHISGFQDGIWG